MLKPYHILFVCTGNICRSPTADVLFSHAVDAQNLRAKFAHDSAGTTADHAGQAPDPRSCDIARTHGISMEHLRSRQVTCDDFYRYDLILAMDNSHLKSLQHTAPNDASAAIELYLPYCGVIGATEVPDPYYGGPEGFQAVYDLLQRASDRLVKRLTNTVY